MASRGARLARAVERVSSAGMALSQTALVLMTALVTVEVLGRNLLNVSTLVADEMAGYLLVAITFLGLGATLRTGGFIRIDTYLRRARGRGRFALDAAIYALAVGYTAVLIRYCARLAWDSYRFGTTSIAITRTPLWVPQLVMVVGLAALLLELVTSLFRGLTGGRAEAEGGASTEL